ncbi:hypothetical protein EB796_007045 [Bugula neritina]|uniref:Uncharacterized protein n=1 Tax=Bugula neritina TaxID=10212 RepID=A0A7J7K9Y6_BUGNE|nr:hypothetical protein EB796_007045 [Bugula neritina]
MINERTENEGWTCLHISTIVNNANVISYILDKIQNEEERRQFIGEMDRLGWTSLQWGCMLDNTASVEETMNKLSLDDQVDLMTRSWSLLHATAQGNAINTMKCLMDRFEDDTTRWKIIKCATLEGKTALHIAIADGKAKAVIMLLDIAGKDSKKLLAIRDRSNRTAQSYTSGQFPLLEQYVESAVKFESPPLHQAALDNDRLLAEWILVTHPDSYGTQISKRNQEGLTVLHSASHANSIEVIEEISKMMTEEEFVNHLLTRSDGGRTALHLAVVHNNPAAIHTILKRIQNSVERKKVMDTVDEGGETALQVSKRLSYNTAEQILEYHQQLVSTEKEKLFHQVQHTFYTLNIPDEKLVSWSQITKEHAEDDLSTRRDVNYDATVSLLQDNPDIEESRRMVEVAQRVDPDNINTWCNKGSSSCLSSHLLGTWKKWLLNL